MNRVPNVDRRWADVMMTLRLAPEVMFGLALRDLRRRRPEVFERLGALGEATIMIAPTDMPVAFRLSPLNEWRPVQVVRHGDPKPYAACISGPLALLLGVLDGSSDADAAFFSRQVVIRGDTETVVGLHNTLEAAELAPSDLIRMPAPLRGVTDRKARRVLKWLSRSGVRA